jgi:hypothetical protein
MDDYERAFGLAGEEATAVLPALFSQARPTLALGMAGSGKRL